MVINEETVHDITEKIASLSGGKAWVKGEKARVYFPKGRYAEVNVDGVNYDRAGRNHADEVIAACEQIGIKYYRR